MMSKAFVGVLDCWVRVLVMVVIGMGWWVFGILILYSFFF